MLAGTCPTRISPQPDILDFWKQSHGALKRVEPRFEVIAQPQAGNPQINVYEVRMRSLGNVRVAGWYEVSKKIGSLPGRFATARLWSEPETDRSLQGQVLPSSASRRKQTDQTDQHEHQCTRFGNDGRVSVGSHRGFGQDDRFEAAFPAKIIR
jgi:hypothetical protein